MGCIRITKLAWRSGLLIGLAAILSSVPLLSDSYKSWTLSEALELLNNSSWAQQETYTQVIGGVGSGIQGEKEIYNTFFIRFLSAAPIRKAYARVKQLQIGFDQMKGEQRRRVDEEIQQGLELNVSHWIVVAVTFRSNNPSRQSTVDQFFKSQTAETVKTRVYLSTDTFPKLQILAYYPPKEESVGAKFVFPRKVDNIPVVSVEDETVIFELDVMGMEPDLRALFTVENMIVNGELVI